VGTKNKNKNIYNNSNLAVVSSSEDIIDDNKIRNDDLRSVGRGIIKQLPDKFSTTFGTKVFY
jgi:hypothetical protein